jgi:hypothetical protein
MLDLNFLENGSFCAKQAFCYKLWKSYLFQKLSHYAHDVGRLWKLSIPAGILEYKYFFYVILYVIILFDIEIDIKIGFIFCVETVFLWDFLCYIYNII